MILLHGANNNIKPSRLGELSNSKAEWLKKILNIYLVS